MNRGWHVEIWGLKICILASSEHVIWRILRNSASAGKFWMLVRTLFLATWCLVNFEVNWYPRWTHHQASPALYQRSGRMKRHTWIHPEGRRWNEMKWIVTCGHHVCNMTLLPTLENAWHDMINGKPVLGLAGSHTESRYRLMRPWTLPPHLS